MNDVLMYRGSRNGGQLSAPVRNRYFYGKLLDVHNLELEQQYFLDMDRLVNRLTLGSGVLCGLHVTAQADGTIVVSPGVAVDGYGREIVVTETVKVDLASLELEEVDGTAVEPGTVSEKVARESMASVWTHQTGDAAHARSAVLCLSYHECPVEPAPVLVADCDLREECVPGAVRERFKLALMNPADAPLPEDPCSIVGRTVEAVPGDVTAVAGRIIDTLPAYNRAPGIVGKTPIGRGNVGTLKDPAATTAAALRQQLCRSYKPPCAPGSDCVPIALLTRTTLRGAVVVNECAPRTTVYSNAVLLDLILCLAEQVEECCNRKVTLTAPKIVDVFPRPGASATLADFKNQKLEKLGVAISFDTKMRQHSLENPSEWLRVMVVIEAGTVAGAIPIPLRYLRTDAKTPAGDKNGQTVYYEFGTPAASGGSGGQQDTNFLGAMRNMLGTLGANASGTALVFVQARADDVTQITGAADLTELLDADFAGTSLPPETLDLLWSAWILALIPGVGTALATQLANLPQPMPDITRGSGNGIEGGVFHSTFTIDF